MKVSEHFRYSRYHHQLDVDAVESELAFEPLRQAINKHGETEDIGYCPDPWSLHKNGDTTGKFAINRDKRVYNCFVCGGGTLLDLTMAIRGWDEQIAEEWLFQYTAPSAKSDDDFLSEIEAILHEETISKPVMPFYNEHVLDRWTDQLVHIEGWLHDRGISDDIAVRARVGYQANALRMAPIKDGKVRDEPYEGPCVYLPHFWGGRLVGWQQRWLDAERPKWLPKYTNTSGFPKVETLYNFSNVYLAQQAVIVCESVPTTLFLASIGFPAIATFGSALSTEQMRLLRRFTQGIVLAPDNDAPGRKWASYTPSEIRLGTPRVLLAEYLSMYVPVKVIEAVGEYDSGNDLGDLIDEGLPFASQAVRVLYDAAEYY